MGCARGIWMTEIRRATVQDAPACAGIVTDWIADKDWLIGGPTAEEVATALREGLPLREAYVIGAPVAGYISIEAEENHIWALYTAAPGQGLGKALMDRAKEGRDYLRLNSHAPNVRAHAFYAREGFFQVGDAWMGNDGVKEIRMEWHR